MSKPAHRRACEQRPSRLGPPTASWSALAGLLCSCALWIACGPERPPQPEDGPPKAAESTAGPAAKGGELDPTIVDGAPGHDLRITPADLEAGALLTYPGPKGEFFDTETLDEVPEGSRGFVKVVLAKGPKPPPAKVWVANFEKSQPSPWPLLAVERDLYEEYALGRGNTSQADLASLPEGLAPPEAAPPPEKIVVYKTSWCGVCKKLQAYLDRKGTDYELKDVEKDPGAAAELKAFAAPKGGWSGSVPVIRIGDEMMVGFDRARLEKML